MIFHISDISRVLIFIFYVDNDNLRLYCDKSERKSFNLNDIDCLF